MTVSSTPSLQPSTQLTLSLWIDQSGSQPDWVRPIQYGQDSANPWGAYNFYIDANSDTALNFALGSTNTSYGLGTAQLTTSTWQYIVGTFDGSAMKLYQDGNLISTRNDSFSIGDYNGTSGLSMGSSWSNWSNWSGYLDETRVASTTRSADWIKTEYNNQSTSTMLSLGDIQASTTSITVDSPSTTQSTLTWDYLNRLTQYVGLSSTSTYVYDPSNERIKSSVTTGTSTQTTYYPTKSYNVTSGVPTKHIFVNGVMVATITGTGASSTVSYILTDHLTGSNVVTNASGTIVELSDYYPYGATRIDDQSGFNEQRKFAGHEFDSSTGLSYMDARYYNPNFGRFLSEDLAFLAAGNNDQVKSITGHDMSKVLSDPQALNSYAYARNNPLRLNDPSGQWFKELITGQQSWSSFQLEFGNAAMYLSDTSPAWRAAMDHPYAAGAMTGLAGGATAVGGVAALTVASNAFLGGLGTACLAFCDKGGEMANSSQDVSQSIINITSKGMLHVQKYHSLESDMRAQMNKSYFNDFDEVQQLIQNAQTFSSKLQSHGTYQTTVDAGRIIGWDRSTQSFTPFYSVISDKLGNLITAYPGR